MPEGAALQFGIGGGETLLSSLPTGFFELHADDNELALFDFARAPIRLAQMDSRRCQCPFPSSTSKGM